MAATTGNPADMSWKPSVTCLAVASVKASSTSGDANGAANTLDKDLRTRWSPSAGGEQWLLYDLGALREVSSASIVWFSRGKNATQYRIELSTDGKKYKVADQGVLDGRGANETLRSFLAQSARYVRIAFVPMNKNGTEITIEEVGIHGTGGQKVVSSK